jgi:hypothetical protein
MERTGNFPTPLFTLDEEELKVVRSMGLPDQVNNWTPEMISGVYDRWEADKKQGIGEIQQMEKTAALAGVPPEVAHSVHATIIAFNILRPATKPNPSLLGRLLGRLGQRKK